MKAIVLFFPVGSISFPVTGNFSALLDFISVLLSEEYFIHYGYRGVLMDLSLLQPLLQDLPAPVQEEIYYRVKREVSALSYVCAPLQQLNLFLIFKNTGGFGFFKTLNGSIIQDMLDDSYVSSRELLGLNAWNLRSAFKLSFPNNILRIQPLSFKELNRTLMQVENPVKLKYLVRTKDLNYPVVLTFDRDILSDLSYREYLGCLTEAYKSKRAEPVDPDTKLVFTVVGYSNRDEVELDHEAG